MKKWLAVITLAAVLLQSLTAYAAAETTNPNAVYVAGNPDLYPFEYFDAETNSYQGILPQVYTQLTEETGMEFVYIKPGMLNQQRRLAKNGQVDLVSAYMRGQVPTAERSLALMRYDDGTHICVGFTAVTPPLVEETIRSTLSGLSDRQLLMMALQVPEPKPAQALYLWGGLIAIVLLVVIVVLCVLLRRRKKQKERSDETRFIDPMTGIGNAAYFENTYRHYVTQTSYALYYLCYFSLDLQRIEQYVGHSQAEELQRYAADVLSQAAADNDFTARPEDGVFLLALQAPSDDAAAARVEELLDRLNNFDKKYLEEYRVWFRAGIFQVDSAKLPVETAVFNARQAYIAAAEKQTPHLFADRNLLNRETTKIELRRKLSEALEKHEFLLYMQLIADQNGDVVGAEALSRWQSREEGLLSPGMYIEPLIQAGLMDRLDLYILELVCTQLEQWHGTDKAHLWISCNFARPSVSRNDFFPRFRDILERHHFERSRLVIELTEDSLMDNTAEAYRNVLQCKELGCRLALDDLGSGYSSLQDLCDYPIDLIKIDRHILLKSSSVRGNALLHGLATLGHGMGMEVLCEGVETEAELRCAHEAGCDYIQGFYYSRVLPQDEANLYYERRRQQRTAES